MRPDTWRRWIRWVASGAGGDEALAKMQARADEVRPYDAKLAALCDRCTESQREVVRYLRNKCESVARSDLAQREGNRE